MKKNIKIYIGIVLLACALTGTITYILVDKKDNKPEVKEPNNNNKENNESKENEDDNNEENKDNNQNEKPNTKEDGVKLARTYNLNDKIIEEFEITLNNKTKTIKVEYAYEEKECLKEVKGTINNNLLYTVENEGFVEDNCKTYSKDKLFNVAKIKNKFNENNFKIIKGTDNKNYLAIYGYSNYIVNESEEEKRFLSIFNDNLELISKDIEDSYDYAGNENMKHDYFYEYQDDTGINIVTEAEGLKWYGNKKSEFEGTSSYKILKIENNQIYYLALNIPEDWYNSYAEIGIPGYGSKIEERVYTINNNKLEYKVIKEYKVKNISNMV